jgi:hypothetical protein
MKAVTWPTVMVVSYTLFAVLDFITAYRNRSRYELLLGIGFAVLAVVFALKNGPRRRFADSMAAMEPRAVTRLVLLAVLAAVVTSAVIYYVCVMETHA